MYRLPKQMRYQAAPLPDGGFSRDTPRRWQPAFGTERQRAARCGTRLAQSAPHRSPALIAFAVGGV